MGSRGKAVETEHGEDKAGRVPIPEPWGAVSPAVPQVTWTSPSNWGGLWELLVLRRASAVPKSWTFQLQEVGTGVRRTSSAAV